MALDGIATGIQVLEDIFFSTAFAGQFWLMQLVILFASILFITRRFSDWGALLLPIMVGWQYAGMNFNYMFWSVATIFFVLNILSMTDVSGAIGAVQQTFGIPFSKKLGIGQGTLQRRGGWKGLTAQNRLIQEGQRVNVREEMDKLKLNTITEKDRKISRRVDLANKRLANAQNVEMLRRRENGNTPNYHKIIASSTLNDASVQKNYNKMFENTRKGNTNYRNNNQLPLIEEINKGNYSGEARIREKRMLEGLKDNLPASQVWTAQQAKEILRKKKKKIKPKYEE